MGNAEAAFLIVYYILSHQQHTVYSPDIQKEEQLRDKKIN